MDALAAYLPEDRVRALAAGEPLPARTAGAALFADISGFTALTEALARTLGPRHGAEVLTTQINGVYEALIDRVAAFQGSVIGFSGDAITCWFDDAGGPAAPRAAACALQLQAAMAAVRAAPLPDGAAAHLALKVAVACGPAARLVVGDPARQLIDVLAGATLGRVAVGEHLARPGEVLLDAAAAAALGPAARLAEPRTDTESGAAFHVLAALDAPPAPQPAAVPPALPPDALAPWLLPVVFARHQAGLGVFLTELRPAVALFLRFTGFDFDADPTAAARLDAFIRRVQAVLAAGDGTLLQLTIGDKGAYLYAVFGAPVAHEDDARRAARAALALRELPGELPGLPPLQIGISQGTLRCGAYGAARRRTYGALGDDVNLAARLMSTAAPGEILVSGAVFDSLGPAFTVEPRPPLQLKGKIKPLPVFALASAASRRAIRLEEPSYPLPLIGRDAELAELAALLDQARAGRGQLVLVSAEAGLGKSRLVAEAIRLARRRGFVGYGGACQSTGAAMPYLVWRPIFQALLDVDPDLPLRRQLRRLEGELEDRAPARVEALPLLGPLLDLDPPPNPFTAALAPQDRKGALEALLVDLLAQAAGEAAEDGGALLVVLEDLHWVDPLSFSLLERVARVAAALPLLVLMASRPSDPLQPGTLRLEELPALARIALGSLDEAALTALVQAKLTQLFPARAAHAPPEALLAAITLRAQGNPFYAEELLNYLRDRGVDPFVPESLASLELPASLHRLVLARIDQLRERERITLQAASVVGRLFRAAWLQGFTALGDLPRIKPALDELARLDLTPLDTPEPDLIYLFLHIVTREVAYESLPRATRAALHEELARWLEAALPDAPPLDLLAHHYDQTENLPRRREYLRRAGDAAFARAANDAALGYFGRLLPLLETPAERAAALLRIAEVLDLLGRWDEAAARFAAAQEQAAAAGDTAARAQAQHGLALIANRRGDFAAGYAGLRRAAELWEAAGDQVALSRTLTALGAAYVTTGAADGRPLLEQAVAIARACGSAEALAHALGGLGDAATRAGDYAGARRLLDEALALLRALGDRRGVSWALTSLGNLDSLEGSHAAARRHYEEALEMFRSLGDVQGVASAYKSLGNRAERQGEYALARELYGEGQRLFKQLGNRPAVAWLYLDLGRMAEAQGEYRLACEQYDHSLAEHRAMGDRFGCAWALFNRGVVADRIGDYGSARTMLDEALALHTELGSKQGMAWALHCLGGLALQQHDYLTAQERLDAGGALFRELNDPLGVCCYLETRATLEFFRGEHAAARAHYAQCLQGNRELGEALNVAWTLVDIAALLLDQGDGEGAWASLQESLAISNARDYHRLQLQALSVAAAVAAGLGRHELAARLEGAVAAQWPAHGIVPDLVSAWSLARARAALPAALAPERYAELVDQGRRLSIAEAVAITLP
jgi:class 3 adenylate cyclase/tetratricopeptide (TPR) repeat protein